MQVLCPAGAGIDARDAAVECGCIHIIALTEESLDHVGVQPAVSQAVVGETAVPRIPAADAAALSANP